MGAQRYMRYAHVSFMFMIENSRFSYRIYAQFFTVMALMGGVALLGAPLASSASASTPAHIDEHGHSQAQASSNSG